MANFELGRVHSNPYARAFKPQPIVEVDGEDHEVKMAEGQLNYIIKSANELKQKLGGMEKNIPGWIQDHISKAHSYLHQANSGYHELGETKKSIKLTSLLRRPVGEKIQKLVEVINESTEPQIITQLRDIVKNQQYKMIKDPKTGKSLRVDMQTANVIVKVYDALKDPKNKEKFSNSGLVGMQSTAFKLMR